MPTNGMTNVRVYLAAAVGQVDQGLAGLVDHLADDVAGKGEGLGIAHGDAQHGTGDIVPVQAFGGAGQQVAVQPLERFDLQLLCAEQGGQEAEESTNQDSSFHEQIGSVPADSRNGRYSLKLVFCGHIGGKAAGTCAVVCT